MERKTSWKIILDPRCDKDSNKLANVGLRDKAEALKTVLMENPFSNPPAYEKLTGYANRYSRRIDVKHRLVYEVDKKEKIIKILSMWSHYE